MDVHLDLYVVVRVIDGGTPQPPQRFKPEDFLLWCAKQLTLAEKVFTCYEAGPFGYCLHRRLAKMGVTNYVIRPRDWDEYGKKVKTDKRDALAMALCLDRYVGGNREAFCVVRVPTEAQEQKRSLSRQRESLQQEKQRLAAQGRSHALYYGGHLQGAWWPEAAWQRTLPQLPAIVVNLLEPLRRLLAAVEAELKIRTRELEAAAPEGLPVGLGGMTSQILEREVADWNRFQEPAPGGQLHRTLSPRGHLQPAALSRLHQQARQPAPAPGAGGRGLAAGGLPARIPPGQEVAGGPAGSKRAASGRRKKIIIAIARIFAVDWWRVRTGRCKAQDLGLTLQPLPPPKTPAP